MQRPLRTLIVAIALAIAGWLVSGCGSDGDSGSDAAVTVVATTPHATDLVANVGGERADIHALLARGADPHGFEPRPSDAAAIADAAVVFKSGGDVDEWLDELVDNAGGEAEVVELIGSVKTLEGGHDGDETDPHWWQDPRNAVRAVAAVRGALIEADPDGRRAYERNAAAYTRELQRLDSEIAACLAKLPADKRKLVTTHDSLGYYARRYDVEVIGSVIPSLSTQAQPSAGDIADLVDQVRDEGVEAVFPEAGADERLERALSRDAGAAVGDPLYADTLGEEGSGADTYVDAMAANTEALVDGMSGGRTACRPR
ncbi:MAG TPA: zinc ABC transporter substrate-binding protein [Thermoleophilaceae bacterium]|nr:zinc ABC transporter substrate-binding protein [Thermoleophilaceae bacterium]